jgi:hypothetical protein
VRSNSLALVPVLIVGLLLRVLRLHVRWDEITLAYAAYAEPLTRALSEGHPSALLGSWIGLHPPLWGVIHAGIELVAPVPWVWMGFSVMCSLAAVYLVGRVGGWVPALVLATAPVHLLDAAEVNNYPLASLAMAALIVSARGSWPQLALAAIFAGWSHLLAGVAGVGLVLWRCASLRKSDRLALVSTVGLGLLPVVGGAMRLMGQGSTWAQPEVPTLGWLSLIAQTVGPEGWLLVPAVIWGLKGATRVAWVCLVVTLLVAVGFDAAAAHQRPYLGLVAPVAAVAIGVAVQRRPWMMAVVAVLCTVRGARFAADDVARFRTIIADLATVRGVDVALEGAAPGDTVWLVSPALQTDDDKTASSSVLWRLRPWQAMPIAGNRAFEYKDYRYGQPRQVAGVNIHTSTELYAAPFDHIASQASEAGSQLWVVVYDHGPATGLMERVQRVLQPYEVAWSAVGKDRGLGVDRVGLVRWD